MAHTQLGSDDTSLCPWKECWAWAICTDWGKDASRLAMAILSGNSSRISTNWRDWIFATSLPGTGVQLFDKMKGGGTFELLLGSVVGAGDGLVVGNGKEGLLWAGGGSSLITATWLRVAGMAGLATTKEHNAISTIAPRL